MRFLALPQVSQLRMFSRNSVAAGFWRIFVIVALIAVFAGCTTVDPNLKIQVSKKANPWTHLNLYNNPDNFQFAIVSDRTGSHRPGVFASAVEKLNLLKPEFVISIGDLIEGYTEDEDELARQWDEFDGLVNKLQMPFFYVPGNHDISNELMAKKWHQRFGPGYYHFIYRNVLFLCLNTEDSPSHFISGQQIEYFRKVIKANSKVRWTLVFLHQPFFWADKYRSKRETFEKFESLLADRPYTVFAGHIHKYRKFIRNGQKYYILAVTGGGMGKEKDECQFDHIVWVTMTDNGPAMANLKLEGILSDEPCPPSR